MLRASTKKLAFASWQGLTRSSARLIHPTCSISQKDRLQTMLAGGVGGLRAFGSSPVCLMPLKRSGWQKALQDKRRKQRDEAISKQAVGGNPELEGGEDDVERGEEVQLTPARGRTQKFKPKGREEDGEGEGEGEGGLEAGVAGWIGAKGPQKLNMLDTSEFDDARGQPGNEPSQKKKNKSQKKQRDEDAEEEGPGSIVRGMAAKEMKAMGLEGNFDMDTMLKMFGVGLTSEEQRQRKFIQQQLQDYQKWKDEKKATRLEKDLAPGEPLRWIIRPNSPTPEQMAVDAYFDKLESQPEAEGEETLNEQQLEIRELERQLLKSRRAEANQQVEEEEDGEQALEEEGHHALAEDGGAFAGEGQQERGHGDVEVDVGTFEEMRMQQMRRMMLARAGQPLGQVGDESVEFEKLQEEQEEAMRRLLEKAAPARQEQGRRIERRPGSPVKGGVRTVSAAEELEESSARDELEEEDDEEAMSPEHEARIRQALEQEPDDEPLTEEEEAGFAKFVDEEHRKLEEILAAREQEAKNKKHSEDEDHSDEMMDRIMQGPTIRERQPRLLPKRQPRLSPPPLLRKAPEEEQDLDDHEFDTYGDISSGKGKKLTEDAEQKYLEDAKVQAAALKAKLDHLERWGVLPPEPEKMTKSKEGGAADRPADEEGEDVDDIWREERKAAGKGADAWGTFEDAHVVFGSRGTGKQARREKRKLMVSKAIKKSLMKNLIEGTLTQRREDLVYLMDAAQISDVEVMNGLYHAVVYWQMPHAGSMGEQEKILKHIKELAGHMRNIIAREINLRRCPDLVHKIDPMHKVAKDAERAYANIEKQQMARQAVTSTKGFQALQRIKESNMTQEEREAMRTPFTTFPSNKAAGKLFVKEHKEIMQKKREAMQQLLTATQATELVRGGTAPAAAATSAPATAATTEASAAAMATDAEAAATTGTTGTSAAPAAEAEAAATAGQQGGADQDQEHKKRRTKNSDPERELRLELAAEFDRTYGLKPKPIGRSSPKVPEDETLEEAKLRIARWVKEYEEMIGGNFAGVLKARDKATTPKKQLGNKQASPRSETANAQVKRLLQKIKEGKKERAQN